MTAAGSLGWGSPNTVDDFAGPSSLGGWVVSDAGGHNGNGRRTPTALSFHDGTLRITGDAAGNSGHLVWAPGQLYGRWEVCAQSPPASPNYHSVALLWPTSLNWPTDGEIDFMEILDPTRQLVTAAVVHRGPDDPAGWTDPNFHVTQRIDATRWRSWAVEWTPDRVVGYVDGVQWFEAVEHIPQTPMTLCLQLDNFGGDISAGGQLNVDWVRQYPLT